MAFLSFQWCVLFVPCVPLHVTFVIVLCFLSFVLIVCMFVCLLVFCCCCFGKGGLLTMDHPLSRSLPVFRSETLSALYFVIVHQGSCGCWCLWINCLLIYFLVCTHVCLSVVLSHNVVLSHTGKYFEYIYMRKQNYLILY